MLLGLLVFFELFQDGCHAFVSPKRVHLLDIVNLCYLRLEVYTRVDLEKNHDPILDISSNLFFWAAYIQLIDAKILINWRLNIFKINQLFNPLFNFFEDLFEHFMRVMKFKLNVEKQRKFAEVGGVGSVFGIDFLCEDLEGLHLDLVFKVNEVLAR